MNSNTPLVSAIMPAYNESKVIGDAIESILRQTLPDWELIIIDDGSTDDTAEIVKQYSDPRIILLCDGRAGVSAARNRAFRYARAPYLVLTDADDISRPERFAHQYIYLVEHPEIAVVGGHLSHLLPDGGQIPGTECLTDPDRIARAFLKGRMPVINGTAMGRKDKLLSTGGYQLDCTNSEDFELFLRMTLSGCKMANLPETVIQYRNDPREIGFRTFHKNELWHRYLLYRSLSENRGTSPVQYGEWRRGSGVRLRMSVWNALRYSRNQIRACLYRFRSTSALNNRPSTPELR